MAVTILPVFGVNSQLKFEAQAALFLIEADAVALGCWVRKVPTGLQVAGTLQQCIELSEKYKAFLGCDARTCQGHRVPTSEGGCSPHEGWKCSLNTEGIK